MDLYIDDACVVFALTRESSPFLSLFPPTQRFPGAPARTQFAGPSWLTILVAETGIGLERARRFGEWVLSDPLLENVAYRPKLLLSAGFCGALNPTYAVGEVVLATEVIDASGKTWPTTWPHEFPNGEWNPPLRRDRLLCTGRLIATPEEKAALAVSTGAGVADMESAALAELCARRNIPFACLKAVSDDAQTALTPRLAACLNEGQPAYGKLLLAMIQSPSLIGEMRRLARNTRVAADQLALALGEILTLTLES